LLVVILFTPVLAAGAIAEERERDRLDASYVRIRLNSGEFSYQSGEFSYSPDGFV
jgi:hypothetical protein